MERINNKETKRNRSPVPWRITRPTGNRNQINYFCAKVIRISIQRPNKSNSLHGNRNDAKGRLSIDKRWQTMHEVSGSSRLIIGLIIDR